MKCREEHTGARISPTAPHKEGFRRHAEDLPILHLRACGGPEKHSQQTSI